MLWFALDLFMSISKKNYFRKLPFVYLLEKGQYSLKAVESDFSGEFFQTF